MPDVTSVMVILRAVFSWAVILAFALVMYAGFRIQVPPLSLSQSIVTIALIFVLAYAVLNTKSCRHSSITLVKKRASRDSGGRWRRCQTFWK
jgi:hypothetical protein